ncbi:class I SAM-dependent methyltransferase [Sphingomicrobium nitratireducens]|uniref:class I SAM-dependent methyltransferase n=1 Tax=Sphingomicrobium nitratireducens TaxID=2964666 RepID=UPI00223EFA87|nr:class I SAM-dependent methyltransferase [Sphingomicrobium nitratireducens]
MARTDEVHWWYRARRAILADFITRRVELPAAARLIEIGTGTGHNLGMLSRFGQVDAVELEAESRAVAQQRLGRPVIDAAMPDLEGVPDRAYDLACLFDVIEHVEHDIPALSGLHRLLKPGGTVVVTVPAYQWLWSEHDEVNQHFRRYTRRRLIDAANAAGFDVSFASYFNTFLFPAVAVARIASHAKKGAAVGTELPRPSINRLLHFIFSLERPFAGRLPLPFGVSIVAHLVPRQA